MLNVRYWPKHDPGVANLSVRYRESRRSEKNFQSRLSTAISTGRCNTCVNSYYTRRGNDVHLIDTDQRGRIIARVIS